MPVGVLGVLGSVVSGVFSLAASSAPPQPPQPLPAPELPDLPDAEPTVQPESVMQEAGARNRRLRLASTDEQRNLIKTESEGEAQTTTRSLLGE